MPLYIERIESPEINPHIYGQFTSDKGGRNIHKMGKSLFNKWYWESWRAAYKPIKLEHIISSYTKINSKWLNYLNIRHGTVKLEEAEHSLT